LSPRRKGSWPLAENLPEGMRFSPPSIRQCFLPICVLHHRSLFFLRLRSRLSRQCQDRTRRQGAGEANGPTCGRSLRKILSRSGDCDGRLHVEVHSLLGRSRQIPQRRCVRSFHSRAFYVFPLVRVFAQCAEVSSTRCIQANRDAVEDIGSPAMSAFVKAASGERPRHRNHLAAMRWPCASFAPSS
jgi:hypothetical protein